MDHIPCAIIGFVLVSSIIWLLFKNRQKSDFSKPAKQSLPILSEWDQKLMAYHEAGHAICSYYLPEREPLVKITIDPSSDAFGMIKTEPRVHHNETRISLNSTISTFLAGRIAEEMFCNEITTSCIYDLAAVQAIASDMVIKFGMGGKTKFMILQNDSRNSIGRQTCQSIEEDIRCIILEAEKATRTVLTEHGKEVTALAQILLNKKTLDQGEIVHFFHQTGED